LLLLLLPLLLLLFLFFYCFSFRTTEEDDRFGCTFHLAHFQHAIGCDRPPVLKTPV